MMGGGSSARNFRGVMLFAAAVVIGAPMAFGQFGIPKVKVPKVLKSSPVEKVVQGPKPAVTAINPSSVPPGWEGDIVLTGSHFPKGMTLRVSCDGGGVNAKEFRVESPERAVQPLSVSHDATDGPCLIAIAFPPGGQAAAEIMPTQQGTVEVMQIEPESATFAISRSSPLGVPWGACLVKEGPVADYDAYLEAQIVYQKQFETNPNFINECVMWISPESVKYVVAGKTIFDRPAATVLKVERFSIPTPFGDQPTGMFSITWTDGKIQNFSGTSKYGGDGNQAYEELKRKLKK